MKKKLLWILVVVLVISFAACGGSGGETGTSGDDTGGADADDKSDWVTLDLNAASYLPANETMMFLQDNYTNGLKSTLGDYVEVTWHNSGTLVTQEGAVDGLKSGMCDIALIELSSFADLFPVSNLWCQPGLGSGGCTGGTASFTEWAQQNAWDLDEYKDMVFLSGQNNGPAVIISKDPVNTPDDVKGLQMRATSVISPTVTAFGGTPVDIAAMEVYESMRNGMVTASYATFGGQAILGWTEFCTNIFAMELNSEVYAYALNRDVWNSMPASQQQAFLDGWNEGFWENIIPEYFWMMVVTSPPISGGAASSNWTIASLESAEGQAFAKLAEPVLEEYKKDLEAQGVEDVDGIVADIQKYQKKWIDDWFSFEGENEFYLACADGTLEDYKSSFALPDNMPTHERQVIPQS
ncbi:MAG: TRAP transporter substrate-binding protein DctP [Clostridiales Family XIII bacterium]|nr:TRAP transporter substrate-binding protein DctP [Clostridiales Family XIII bacterium]